MDDLTRALLAKTPKCIAHFKCSSVSIPLPGSWNTGPQFITQAIICQCGNENLYLEAAQYKHLKGVCRKQQFISFAAPIYINCNNCKSFRLLFNPLMHGWRGETNEEANTESEYSLISCSIKPGRVYVNYSYRYVHNYEALVSKGIENPEDYFDTFTVFHQSSASENIIEILSMVLTNAMFTH